MKKLLLILPIILAPSSIAFCKVQNHVLGAAEPLMINVPKKLADMHVMQLRTFLRQADHWSCGFRAVFSANAIEDASKKNKFA